MKANQRQVKTKSPRDPSAGSWINILPEAEEEEFSVVVDVVVGVRNSATRMQSIWTDRPPHSLCNQRTEERKDRRIVWLLLLISAEEGASYVPLFGLNLYEWPSSCDVTVQSDPDEKKEENQRILKERIPKEFQ